MTRRWLWLVVLLLVGGTLLDAALPASDTFTGTGALGGNWTRPQGSFERISDVATPSGAAESTAYWSADAFADDHYAQLTVVVVQSTATGAGGPSVRMSGTGVTTQHYMFSGASNGNQLYKVTSGTTYALLQTLGGTTANGDILKATVSGTTIKCYQNGAQIGSDQSDSALASGSAGMFTYGGASKEQFDDFSANNNTVATSAPRLGLLGVGS